jgi:hypothetical protein
MRCLIVVIALVVASEAIYIQPGDTHEGLDGMEHPHNARMLDLRGAPVHMKEDMAIPSTVVPGDTEDNDGEGDGHRPMLTSHQGHNHGEQHDENQCTYTFRVPQSQSQQCADAAKIHALERKIDELTTTVDKVGQRAVAGEEIRGRPVIRDYHFQGKDDHTLTYGSPSDDLIFALIIMLYEEEALSFGRDYHVFRRW